MTKTEITKIIDRAADKAAKAAEKRFQRVVNAAVGRAEKRFQRYVGTQKEHFDDKVKAIGEQYSSIKATQDEHTRILNQHSETLEKQRIILNNHSETLNEHTDILKANQETLLEHDAKLGEMQNTLKRIESKLDTKADKSTVDQIERRVTTLENAR